LLDYRRVILGINIGKDCTVAGIVEWPISRKVSDLIAVFGVE
jgi:hypothetical protein